MELVLYTSVKKQNNVLAMAVPHHRFQDGKVSKMSAVTEILKVIINPYFSTLVRISWKLNVIIFIFFATNSLTTEIKRYLQHINSFFNPLVSIIFSLLLLSVHSFLPIVNISCLDISDITQTIPVPHSLTIYSQPLYTVNV